MGVTLTSWIELRNLCCVELLDLLLLANIIQSNCCDTVSLGWVKDEIVRVCNNPMQQLSYVGASLDVLVIIIVVFRKPYLLLCVSELTGAIFFQFAKCYCLISKCISSICKICLFNLQNVFVQFAKCVC